MTTKGRGTPGAKRKPLSGGARRALRNADAKAKNPGSGLTLKEELFVEAYVGAAMGSGAEAARLAGYAGETREQWRDQAAGVMSRQRVKDAIAVRVAAVKKCMGADEVLERLSDLAVSALKASDRIRALELLGKHYRLFVEKIDVSGSVTVNLTPEQKAARVTELIALGLERARERVEVVN